MTPGCLEFAGGGGTISTLTGIVSFILSYGNNYVVSPKLQNLYANPSKDGRIPLNLKPQVTVEPNPARLLNYEPQTQTQMPIVFMCN